MDTMHLPEDMVLIFVLFTIIILSAIAHLDMKAPLGSVEVSRSCFGFTISSYNLDCCSFKCLNCHEIVVKIILKGNLGANGTYYSAFPRGIMDLMLFRSSHWWLITSTVRWLNPAFCLNHFDTSPVLKFHICSIFFLVTAIFFLVNAILTN